MNHFKIKECRMTPAPVKHLNYIFQTTVFFRTTSRPHL